MAYRTYRLTQQGQITDRYTKAIDQLGSDKLETRLGGIYALERIAVDSERDHRTVVEVLGAFAREQGGQPPPHNNADPATVEHGATDVEAAVTVLGRLPDRFDTSRANLASVYLASADLSEANLRGASLREANLSGANLSEANLSEANLRGANLQGTFLDRVHLGGAQCSAATVWPDGFDWKAAGVRQRD
jgi:hypothetical protein